MKFLVVILLLVVPLSFTEAKVLDLVDYPQQFSFSCGEMSHKVPFDISDQGTMLNVDVNATATKIDPPKLPGFYLGRGIGYNVIVKLEDAELTGVSAPINIVFQCYDVPTGDLDTFTCFDNVMKFPSIPHFNMWLLHFPVPSGNFDKSISMGGSEIGIRTVQETGTKNQKAERYYTFQRELDCQFSR